MEKIVEYKNFDDDIVPGDIVVLNDGVTRKTIQKIVDGHRVAFTDGSGFDLYVVSIKGIIKIGNRNTKTTGYPTSYIDINAPIEPFIERKKQAVVSSNDDCLTYQELFKMMESSDYSGLGFSKYFWHYTTLSNLLAIVGAGKFKSRYDVRGTIPYDNEIYKILTDNGFNIFKFPSPNTFSTKTECLWYNYDVDKGFNFK